MWWELFWCWKGAGTGWRPAAVNGSRPGTQRSRFPWSLLRHYDIRTSWMMWAVVLVFFYIIPWLLQKNDVILHIRCLSETNVGDLHELYHWKNKLSHSIFSHFPQFFCHPLCCDPVDAYQGFACHGVGILLFSGLTISLCRDLCNFFGLFPTHYSHEFPDSQGPKHWGYVLLLSALSWACLNDWNKLISIFFMREVSISLVSIYE